MFNDPRQKNKYMVSLAVRNFECLPGEITNLLGIEPTEILKKGEFRIVGKKKPRKMLNKVSYWELASKLPVNESIENHLESLLNVIKPYRQNFIKVAEKYSLEFICVSYYYEANPGVSLENKLLREIAELKAKLYFDIYCLGGTIRQLEDPNVVTHLSNHLKDVKFLSRYDHGKVKEAHALINSLKGIEEACHNLKNQYIQDLIWNEKPLDSQFEATFKTIAEALKLIDKKVRESQYLSILVKD